MTAAATGPFKNARKAPFRVDEGGDIWLQCYTK